MKIQVDEEGKQAVHNLIEAGMRRGAWGEANLLALVTIQQAVTLIREPVKDDVG